MSHPDGFTLRNVGKLRARGVVSPIPLTYQLRKNRLLLSQGEPMHFVVRAFAGRER